MNKAERRKRTIHNLHNAHTAMELFDIAAQLMERVRGNYRTQQTAQRLGRLLTRARNGQLGTYDRARAALATKESP